MPNCQDIFWRREHILKHFHIKARRPLFFSRPWLWAVLALLAVGAPLAAHFLHTSSTGVRLHTRRPAQRHVVAVDAGHGGADTGAHGLVNETQVTQATAAALLALLEADPAYYPVQVHTPDEKLSPKQRVEVARQANAELFLSLHANKDGSAASHGFECYAVPPGHDYHRESLTLAQLLCTQMADAGARIRGDNGVRYAYYRSGSKMMKEAGDTTAYSYPTFGVLQKPACPAVLIEQCFITNAGDLDAWGDADGCTAAAVCYYRAICAYFGTQPIEWTAAPDGDAG